MKSWWAYIRGPQLSLSDSINYHHVNAARMLNKNEDIDINDQYAYVKTKSISNISLSLYFAIIITYRRVWRETMTRDEVEKLLK